MQAKPTPKTTTKPPNTTTKQNNIKVNNTITPQTKQKHKINKKSKTE